MPETPFDQFITDDPADAPVIPSTPKAPTPFDQFISNEPVAPKRSTLGELGTAVRTGFTEEVPLQAGQALQWAGEPTGGGIRQDIYETGKSLADAAKARQKLPENMLNPDKHGAVVNALAEGGKMLAPSVAAPLAIGGGLAALGAAAPELAVGGAVGLGLASVLGSAPAAMQQGQQTLESVQEAGGTDEAARSAGWKNLAIEGAGESLGTFVGGKFVGLAGKTISKAVAPGMAGTIAGATDTAILKPFANNLVGTAATEVGTELGQSGLQAVVERGAGVDVDPLEQMKGVVGPTLGMTAWLSPFGLHANYRNSQKAKAIDSILADPSSATPEQRLAVVGDIHKEATANKVPDADEWLVGAIDDVSADRPVRRGVSADPLENEVDQVLSEALNEQIVPPAPPAPGPMQDEWDQQEQDAIIQNKIKAGVPLSEAEQFRLYNPNLPTAPVDEGEINDIMYDFADNEEAAQDQADVKVRRQGFARLQADEEMKRRQAAAEVPLLPGGQGFELLTPEAAAGRRGDDLMNDWANDNVDLHANEQQRVTPKRYLLPQGQGFELLSDKDAAERLGRQYGIQPSQIKLLPGGQGFELIEGGSEQTAVKKSTAGTPYKSRYALKKAITAQGNNPDNYDIEKYRGGWVAVPKNNQGGKNVTVQQNQDSMAGASLEQEGSGLPGAQERNIGSPGGIAGAGSGPDSNSEKEGVGRSASIAQEPADIDGGSIPGAGSGRQPVGGNESQPLGDDQSERVVQPQLPTGEPQLRVDQDETPIPTSIPIIDIKAEHGRQVGNAVAQSRANKESISLPEAYRRAGVEMLTQGAKNELSRTDLSSQAENRTGATGTEEQGGADRAGGRGVEPSAAVGAQGNRNGGVGGGAATGGVNDVQSGPANGDIRNKVVDNPASIAHGSEVNLAPTEAQKESENYKTAKVNIDGLNLSIENPAGSVRSGKDAKGKEWSQEMKADYGRILGSKGFDKDHVDIFVAPGYKGGATHAYVVNQHNADGKFDEHKAVVGVSSEQEALDLYNSNYEAGWTGGKSVTRIAMPAFKTWVASKGPSRGALVRGGTVYAGAKLATPTVKENSTVANATKKGVIGEKLATGETRLTATGRETTPFPKVSTDGNRKVQNTLKRVDRWLMDNALAEAESRGDEYNARMFRANLDKPQQADKDSAEMYLFGDKQPKVVPSILKDLTAKQPEEKKSTLDQLKEMSDDDIDNLFDKVDAERNAPAKGKAETEAKSEPRPQKPPRKKGSTETFLFDKDGNRIPQTKKAAGQITKEAGIAANTAVKEAMSGLSALFGDKNTLRMGPAFDEETYRKAKPHFVNAWNGIKDVGYSVSELINYFYDQFGDKIRPYLQQFAKDLRDGNMAVDLTTEPDKSTIKEKGGGTDGNNENITGSGNGDVRPDDEAAPGPGDNALEGMAPEGIGSTGESGTAPGRSAQGGGKNAAGNKKSDAGRVPAPRSGRGNAAKVHPPDTGKGSDSGDGKRVDTPSTIPAANFRITEDVRLGKGGEVEKFNDNLAAIRTLKTIEAEKRRATPDEQRTLARYVGWGGLANAFKNGVTGEVRTGWEDRVSEVEKLLSPEELAVARNSAKAAHYTSFPVVTAMWNAIERLGFKGGNVLEPSVGVGNFLGLMPESMAGSANVMAVEYDNITAGIARHLYPQASVFHSGFQDLPLPANSFDLVIGNPPFGRDQLTFPHSPDLNHYTIHHQFFLAGIEALRPGGLQAMVVSRYLMDGNDSTVRELLANQADLVAAIRLPDTAFKENARTDVVTDIIILQKRNQPLDTKQFDAAGKELPASPPPSWTQTSTISDPLGGEPMRVSRYFAENPGNVIGRLERSGTMHGDGTQITVKLDKSVDIAERLAKIVRQLPRDIAARTGPADKVQEYFKNMVDAMKISLSGQEFGSISFNEFGELEQVIDRETDGGDTILSKRVLGPSSVWSPSIGMDKDGKWFREVDKVELGKDGKPVLGKDGKPTKVKVMAGDKATKRNEKTREVFENESKVSATMKLGETGYKRLVDAIKLRDTLLDQINLETSDSTEQKMEANRAKLRRQYAAFVQDHSHINDSKTADLINGMPNAALLLSLEAKYKPPISKDKARKLGITPLPAEVEEATILSKRAISPTEKTSTADTPHDALAICLSESGRVDLARIAELLGKSEEATSKALHDDLDTPLIFMDPEAKRWEQADEYLGGNVVRKLEAAKAAGLQKNVDAIEKILPAPWTADKVTATMGAAWIPGEVYADFLSHLTGGPANVKYFRATNTFHVEGQVSSQQSPWGTGARSPVQLLDSLLNNRPIRVTYTDRGGNIRTDNELTEEANAKADEIREEFDGWAFKDSDRRNKLVKIFNDKFNVRVTRQRDGQHLQFPGKVPDTIISMRRHQKNAVWRGIVDRVVLYDHAVGSGKTFTGIARAIERKRMGLSRKPMIVVPNHMVLQFAKDVYKLYPGAKILAAGKSDLSPAKRRRIFAKIATGDWDVVIVPHSSFKFIGISPATETRYLNAELAIANEALKEAREETGYGEDQTFRKPLPVKEAEALRDKILSRLKQVKERGGKKDRLLTFEQLGVDDLTIDEAHEFKNLFYNTSLNVRGMNPKGGSGKAYDLWTKTRVLHEMPNGSVAFMTGTPISNSAVEMYNIMRYLVPEQLEEFGMEHFDAWRNQFVSVNSAFEPTDSGKGLKEVSRLGRDWSNTKSLMDLYYTFADCVTNDDIQKWYAEDHDGARFPMPRVKGGGRVGVNVKPTPAQRQVIEDIVAGFESLDNIDDIKVRNATRLRLMDRARKVSIDARAVDPRIDSKEEGGKLARVSDEVTRLYKKWHDDKGTQLVFLDRSVVKSKGDDKLIREYDELVNKLQAAERTGDEDAMRRIGDSLERFDPVEIEELKLAQAGGWNAYQQIKDNLVASGIPSEEIRFIQEANTDDQKKILFEEVNSGKVRILIGSTQRMGAGTNVQERLVGLHHVDVTWKPSDIEQREGRIIRQGNLLYEQLGEDFEVEIMAYTTDTTVDAKMWALNSTKLKMINGIRHYDGSFTMEFDDTDSVGMAEIAAIASGEPLQLERVQLAAEIDKLGRLRRAHERQRWGAEDSVKRLERIIAEGPGLAKALGDAAKTVEEVSAKERKKWEGLEVDIDGKSYPREKAFEKFEELKKKAEESKDPFSATIDGEKYRSKQKAHDAITARLGDGAFFSIGFDGKKFNQRGEATKAIVEAANKKIDEFEREEGIGWTESNDIALGTVTIHGVEVDLSMQLSTASNLNKNRQIEYFFEKRSDAGYLVNRGYVAALSGGRAHTSMPTLFRGPVDEVEAMGWRASVEQSRIDDAKRDLPAIKELASKPFPKEGEIAEKETRLQVVEKELEGRKKAVAETQGEQQQAPDSDIQYSKSGSTTGRTVAQIKQELRAELGDEVLDSLQGTVSVIGSQDEAKRIIDNLKSPEVLYSEDGETIQGFTSNKSGKVWLVADGIQAGRAADVLNHEVGVHLRQLLLSDKEYLAVEGSLSRRQSENTRTGRAIRQAMARVPKGTKPAHYWSEVLAYMVEDSPQVGQVRRLLAAAKRILIRVFGTRFVSWLSVDDIKALAIAAVRRDVGLATDKESLTVGFGQFAQSVMMSTQQAARAIFSKLQQVSAINFTGMKAQGVLNFLNKNGVKKAEIEATGLDAWIAAKKPTDKVSREELTDFVRANMVEVEDVVLGSESKKLPDGWSIGRDFENYITVRDTNNSLIGRGRTEAEAMAMADDVIPNERGGTHFAQYTEPNADPGSYREMFVAAPYKSDYKVVPINTNGETKYRIVRISDNRGFGVRKTESEAKERAEYLEKQDTSGDFDLSESQSGLWFDGHQPYKDIKNPIVRIRFNTETRDGKTYLRIEEMQGPSDTNQQKMPQYLRDNIYQIGTKRIIAMAKEMGVDGITFATKPGRTAGETQADRYSLEKQIEKIDYNKNPDGTYDIDAKVAYGDHDDISKIGLTPAELVETIGKDATDKIISGKHKTGEYQDGAEYGTLENTDLVIGGEGLKQLYDRQLPAMLEAYSKEKMVDGVLPITGKTPGSFPLFSKAKTGGTKPSGFGAWFGKSKITRNNKPVILYHGTNDTRFLQDPTYNWTFDPRRAARQDSSPFAGLGIFLGNESIAMAHSGGNEKAVHPFYVRVENPLVIDSAELEKKVTDLASAKAFRKRAMELNGHDGIIIKDRGQVIAFEPNQLKSASENTGEYSRDNDDVRYSVFTGSQKSYDGITTEEQNKTIAAVFGKPKTLVERAKEFKKNWQKNIIQGIFDQYAPLFELSPEAYIQARMTKGGDSTLEAILMYGKPYYDRSEGAIKVRFDKANNAMNGFAQVLSKLDGEHDLFLKWVAGLRAEKLKEVGLENLMTDEHIKNLKSLNRGKLRNGNSRRAAYHAALQGLNDYNDAVLRIAVDRGLINDATRQMYQDMPYLPFYRLADEGAVNGFTASAGLVNQSAWKQLKGGTNKLNDDMLANLLQNWSHLITASARNEASKTALEAAVKAGVAHEVPNGFPGKGTVSFKDNTTTKLEKDASGNYHRVESYIPAGQKYIEDGIEKISDGAAQQEVNHDRTFLIDDPSLMDAVASLGKTLEVPSVLKQFKHFLTIGVTANPAFKIRNLARDTIASMALADMSYNPAKNLKEGFKAAKINSEARAQLLAGGGIIRFGAMLDGANADNARELVEKSVSKDHILDDRNKITKLWKHTIKPAIDVYQEFGDRGEQINRLALYNRLVEKGMTHGEASFWARDLMDFSMSGKWAAVRFLTQTVPFMNARLQGLYKLGKSARADKKRFGYVVGGVALASLALAVAYGDDDDWKNREDWDRDNYWWFKVGGVAFRLPKPFEIGAIGTIAERGYELMADKEMTGKRFRERIGNIVTQQLSMNPTPQLIKPLIDLWANKDSFSGRPIESMGMERLKPEDRYSERTSGIAKVLGSLGLPNPSQAIMGNYEKLSPAQIDFLVKGYFSWLGTSTTTALDYGIFKPLSPGSRPSMQLRDVFLVGNFVETLPTGSSRYVTQLYEQAKEIEQAYASYHNALKTGNKERATEIMASDGNKIRSYKQVEAIKRRESELNQRIKMIQADREMSSGEKRTKIDAVNAAKQRVAKRLSNLALNKS